MARSKQLVHRSGPRRHRFAEKAASCVVGYGIRTVKYIQPEPESEEDEFAEQMQENGPGEQESDQEDYASKGPKDEKSGSEELEEYDFDDKEANENSSSSEEEPKRTEKRFNSYPKQSTQKRKLSSSSAKSEHDLSEPQYKKRRTVSVRRSYYDDSNENSGSRESRTKPAHPTTYIRGGRTMYMRTWKKYSGSHRVYMASVVPRPRPIFSRPKKVKEALVITMSDHEAVHDEEIPDFERDDKDDDLASEGASRNTKSHQEVSKSSDDDFTPPNSAAKVVLAKGKQNFGTRAISPIRRGGVTSSASPHVPTEDESDHESLDHEQNDDRGIDTPVPSCVRSDDNEPESFGNQDDLDAMDMLPEEPQPTASPGDINDYDDVDKSDTGAPQDEVDVSTRIREFLGDTASFRSTFTNPNLPVPDGDLENMRAQFQEAMRHGHTSKLTNKQANTDTSAQKRKSCADSQTFGPFGWGALERMKRSNVNPFNLPVSDLQEKAQANATQSSGEVASLSSHQPQTAQELRELFISALVPSTSSYEQYALATAEVDLQAAKLSLRNAEIKERMSTLRETTARVQQNKTSDVTERQVIAKQAAVEFKKAKTAVNLARKKVREAKKVLRELDEEFEDREESEDEDVMAKHVTLVGNIDGKILELQKQEKALPGVSEDEVENLGRGTRRTRQTK
ncbi:uncharacterized protein K460DRAFT_354845 [Cucurbitaria berberidis CBS 394.84]|uniref:Uncharacterized protein n=1 Tax=Cucurbitaria berberidis CBS 394.84 TaxID=1168544 RepID=A0A9P4L866_9PLEO|nr:uncharacterized protein K460DRAFT_354845 [Cucurbitaria berberidis CBS 394.84]KAF1844984.1 hypothetical protein K460DRAFT_354845 [Cucurbitaria berberidis CBS 394.84]